MVIRRIGTSFGNNMAFHPKDLKSDEHRKRHPLGRIPVLDDGDIRGMSQAQLLNMY